MAVAYIFTSIVSEEVMALIIYLLMSCIYFIVSKVVTLKRISEIMQRPDIVLICVLVTGTIVVVACIFMTKMFEGVSEEQLQITIQTIIQIEDNLKEIRDYE